MTSAEVSDCFQLLSLQYAPRAYWNFITKDCAEWMLQPFFLESFKKGAFHLDKNANSVPADKLHLTLEAQDAVYKHFIEETGKY